MFSDEAVGYGGAARAISEASCLGVLGQRTFYYDISNTYCCIERSVQIAIERTLEYDYP